MTLFASPDKPGPILIRKLPVLSTSRCPLFIASDLSGFVLSSPPLDLNLSRRRRRCGNVEIRRFCFWPDFQARREVWETRLGFWSFPGFPRRIISTAGRPRFWRRLQRLARGAVARHHLGSVDDGHPPVQMLADRDPATRQRPAPGGALQLPD